MTEAAARGERELFYLDQCGFAPTLPTSYTWARAGTRPLLRYKAPQGPRVNVLGAFAPCGPQRQYTSRVAAAVLRLSSPAIGRPSPVRRCR